MPDRRQHRGPHPEDTGLFRAEMNPILRAAVSDLSWLLSSGYAEVAALKIVGDHFQLAQRQRLAVMRSSCSDASLARRRAARLDATEVRDQSLALDGFNVLTTIEAVLSGGVLLIGRDGCCRDMASMHGNYRHVEETMPALESIGELIASLHVAECRWLLDSPVSNSGRLRRRILDLASERGWNWHADLVENPDTVLAASAAVVCTADSVVLDACARWFNLARDVIERSIPGAHPVDLE
ncbi:MAG: DUF434 domain-containing protein [Planctomycetes bacterium]|nr:DUF434 domain-containing protein [Planctomycetota bacterium]